MTSEEKVRKVYPDADVVHQRAMGITVYAITPKWASSLAVGLGFSKSKAWVQAAKNIVEGKELERL